MSDFTDFYSLFTKGRAFGYLDDVYAGGWHRGQDVPGAVPGASWLGKEVPLLLPGRLVYRGQQAKLGGVSVYQASDGEYWGYSHTRNLAGGGFRLSSWDDPAQWRGSSWGGPHLHLVRSKFMDASWNTRREVLDPRPIIVQRLREETTGSGAGGNGKPIGEDMLDDADKAWLKSEIAKAVWQYKSNVNNLMFGDMTRVTYDATRVGSKGIRTDGALTTMVRDIQRKVGALDTASMTDAQVDELADELQAALPPAIITALGKQLLKK